MYNNDRSLSQEQIHVNRVVQVDSDAFESESLLRSGQLTHGNPWSWQFDATMY